MCATFAVSQLMRTALEPTTERWLFAAFLFAFAIKVPMFPLHTWLPDAHTQAPTAGSVDLAGLLSKTGTYAILRFAFPLFPLAAQKCAPLLLVLGLIGLLYAAWIALAQNDMKRLVAYSSIEHMGYLLMALLAVKANGASAVMFYSAVYALMDLGAFGSVGLLSAKQEDLDALDSFKGLGYSHPWTAGLLAVSLFSLAGLPPTAGFIGKFLVFRAALQADFIILAIVGILTAIISVYFYLKVIVILYMSTEESTITPPRPDFFGDFACGMVLVLLFWLGALPSFALSIIARIVASLTA